MAEVTFTPNPQPAPACYPSDVNGLLTMLTTGGGINGTIPDTAGGGIFVSSSPPASSLTNKVWFKTDAAGRPLGIYAFYNGNWRKWYTGAIYGEIRQYIGTNGAFDGNGLGLIGGDLDGWAVCNGANGTPNLHGCNLKGGHLGVTVGRGDGWWSDMETPGTWVRSGGTYGAHTIGISNLPDLIYEQFGIPGAQSGSGAWAASGATGTALGFDHVKGYGGGTTEGSPNTPIPWETYTVVAMIMFVGYG